MKSLLDRIQANLPHMLEQWLRMLLGAAGLWLVKQSVITEGQWGWVLMALSTMIAYGVITFLRSERVQLKMRYLANFIFPGTPVSKLSEGFDKAMADASVAKLIQSGETPSPAKAERIAEKLGVGAPPL